MYRYTLEFSIMVRVAKSAKAPPFPLWLHTGKGLWAKKIRGRMTYFGSDKDAAMKEYVRVKDDLEAGRVPRPKTDSGLTVRDLINQFLSHKRERVACGELTAGTWGEYFTACERLIEAFGRERDVADLRPADFGALRASAAKRLGPVALTKCITLTRSVFKYAYEAELIEKPVRVGNTFDKPPSRTFTASPGSQPAPS